MTTFTCRRCGYQVRARGTEAWHACGEGRRRRMVRLETEDE